MPADDPAVLRAYARSGGDLARLAPWAQRLRPADRLVLPYSHGVPPPLPALEWAELLPGIWSGGLPAGSH